MKWIKHLEFEHRVGQKPTLELTNTELERMFAEADVNDDGYVDRREFQLMIVRFHEKLTKVAIICS